MERENWNLYRTRFLVRARALTEPLSFTDLFGREQSGQPGDYLLETSDGVRRITSRALFEDIYVPISGDPEACLPADVQNPSLLSAVAPPTNRLRRPTIPRALA
jgi:hypothetical protein